MKAPSRKVVVMQWIVIIVLIGGFMGTTWMLTTRLSAAHSENDDLKYNVDSLRRQLRATEATPTPTPSATPVPTPVATPTPAPTVAPKVTPKATATPKR